MKSKIGEARNLEEYEEQISYCESILATLEELQLLYGEDNFFKNEYKEIGEDMKYIEEVQSDIRNEMEEEIERHNEEYDEELITMNADFERSQY